MFFILILKLKFEFLRYFIPYLTPKYLAFAHLFVKISRPGESDVILSIFCTKLLPVTISITTQRYRAVL